MLLATLALAGAAVQVVPEPAHDFEVLVLGTLHAPFQFRHPAHTPAHVEAVLRAAEPDVIGVESNPTWFAAGEFYPVTYEAQGVAVPFAAERDIPVVGIDWMDIDRWDRMVAASTETRRAALVGAATSGPLALWQFGLVPGAGVAELDSFMRDPGLGFAEMNGLGDDATTSKWLPPGSPTDKNWGGRRNQEIYRACLDAMRGRAGERLVVVIGGGHKPVLDGLFGATEGVRVLRFGDDIALPTRGELDAAWTPEHLAATLGHNLDGERTYLTPALVDLERMKSLADRLAEMRGHRPVAAYFRGRIAYEEGRFEDATTLWEGLQETFGQWNPYPFPMDHWRMRYGWAQTIQLEQARTLLALDRRDEAEEILRRLPGQLPEVPDLVVSDRTRDALVDPGFESGEIARNPSAGWYGDDVLTGHQRASADEPVEGERSLRIDVLRAREHGLSSLAQTIPLDDTTRAAGAFEFSVRARAEGIETLTMVAYRWDEERQRVVELARVDVDLSGGEWTRGTLDVDLPGDLAVVRLFLYFPGVAGARIWFDDARTYEAPVVTTPEEWVPRTLAREFPRTLLEVD